MTRITRMGKGFGMVENLLRGHPPGEHPLPPQSLLYPCYPRNLWFQLLFLGLWLCQIPPAEGTRPPNPKRPPSCRLGALTRRADLVHTESCWFAAQQMDHSTQVQQPAAPSYRPPAQIEDQLRVQPQWRGDEGQHQHQQAALRRVSPVLGRGEFDLLVSQYSTIFPDAAFSKTPIEGKALAGVFFHPLYVIVYVM